VARKQRSQGTQGSRDGARLSMSMTAGRAWRRDHRRRRTGRLCAPSGTARRRRPCRGGPRRAEAITSLAAARPVANNDRGDGSERVEEPVGGPDVAEAQVATHR
jgi:hypothetical protein